MRKQTITRCTYQRFCNTTFNSRSDRKNIKQVPMEE